MQNSELLSSKLLDEFQVIVNHEHEIEAGKKRVLCLEEHPSDPKVQYLNNGGWKKYHLLVFKSYWQQSLYKAYFGIPYSAGTVLRDAINPIEPHEKTNDRINIVYTAQPHCGLELLYIVFRKLSAEFEELELDVYSSFAAYGWEEGNKHLRELFRLLREHPKINYYGSASEVDIRAGLKNGNIFCLPATVQESANKRLFEAMSSGLVCVHSSNGALPEISMNLTYMYEYSEDVQHHVNALYTHLRNAILTVKSPSKELQMNLELQKQIIDRINNLEHRTKDWDAVLRSLLTEQE